MTTTLAAAALVPLTTREPDDVVAWLDRQPVRIADLLADAAALSDRLPGDGALINACANRYAFLVAFLACAMRERACLLPGGQTPHQLAALRREVPHSTLLIDAANSLAGPDTDALVVPGPTGARRWQRPMPALAPDQVACIAFTSGSTGRPVAHARSWGTLMVQTEAAARRFALTGARTVSVVATVPHNHMYGFETTILLPLRANVAIHGGTPLYPDDVRSALDAMPLPRVLVTSPVHLRALAHSARALPELRTVISATAPLATELAASIEAQGSTEVLEIYGCTETGSVGTRRTVTETDWTSLDCVTLEAAADEEPGAVCARLPHAAHAVVLNDVITLMPGTGAERRFRLHGRREDLIKVGGKRGSLAGLTAILLGIEGVRDGAFVMPEAGERDDATRPLVVVAAPGLAPKAILDELRRRIDPAFVPRRVIMTDALPRNPLGKLPRAWLATLLAESGEPDTGGR